VPPNTIFGNSEIVPRLHLFFRRMWPAAPSVPVHPLPPTRAANMHVKYDFHQTVRSCLVCIFFSAHVVGGGLGACASTAGTRASTVDARASTSGADPPNSRSYHCGNTISNTIKKPTILVTKTHQSCSDDTRFRPLYLHLYI
jgi:hypothetical protein